MKKALSIILAVLMLCGIFAGCGQQDTQATEPPAATEGEVAQQPAETEGTSGDEVKVLRTNGGPVEFFDSPWLNPGFMFNNKVIYDTLITCDANKTPTDGVLAESYSMDGNTQTFVLREGVTWHDGEPFTAEDVKFSIERSLQTGLLNSMISGVFYCIEGTNEFMDGTADEISGVAIDGNTVTITMASDSSDTLLAFSQFAIVPKHLLEDVDPAQWQQSEFFQNPVGTGPFKVKEVSIGNYCILEPNENYFDGVADFEIYCYASAGDSDANLVTNALAGNYDYAFIKQYDDVKSLRAANAAVNIDTVSTYYTRFFLLNQFDKADGTTSPFADVRVRQAVAYAIDAAAICESIFEGAAQPADSLVPNIETKLEGLNDYGYNPEKAKELLDEAGWDSSRTLICAYYYTDQQTVDLMAILQQQLGAVGINIEPKLITGDINTYLWTRPSDKENGPSAVEWDILYAAKAAASLYEYYSMFSIESSINSHYPYNEETENMINAIKTSDPEAQLKALHTIEQYENDNLLCVPLYYQPVWVISSDAVRANVDVWGDPQWRWDWNVQNWEIG